MKAIKRTILWVLMVAILIAPTLSFAADNERRLNPKLANYFLKWTIEDYEVEELSHWDLLILDMETQENSRANLEKIRQLNPNIKIIAYITSQEIIGDIYQNQYQQYAHLRKKLVNNLDDSWWLRDKDGGKISFWPGTYMLNVTDGCGVSANGRWNEYLPRFVNDEILSTGLWDGVFYDNLWGDVGWVWGGKIDVDRDGKIKAVAEINRKWSDGVKKMLATTRKLIGDNYIIIGNGMIFDGYQTYINGMMFEGFPSAWENGGTWQGSMKSYFKIQDNNKKPNITVVNTYNKDRSNYQKMRFSLMSTLLRDNGYFSFDYDNTNHTQLWWYDEYDVNLGKPLYPAKNLLNKDSDAWQPGLWRKDYENGIVLVNSTKTAQKYIFSREEFEKIRGAQDRSVNNGAVVNWVKIEPSDGVILLKRKTEITNNSFYNGYFVRVFNEKGKQTRGGFFSYLDSFAGSAQILIADLDKDGIKEVVSNNKGAVTIYRDGRLIKSFNPYSTKFKGAISVAVSDLDSNGSYEILAGASSGPQVQVMSKDGKLLGTFFAYDKNFRGGVNVAAGELDKDGIKEIVTGPGAGGEPEVRIYNKSGKLLNKFLAYDKKFKGGVSVAVGDINGDGKNEIVTGAGAGGGPEVRIFNSDGKLLGKFAAYDNTIKTGVKVMTEDINNDKIDEILATVVSL